MTSVKAFGEFEFWFAMIKVVTIVLMIIAGFGLIFFGIGNGGHAIGISNLWSHGGFMPNGFVGFFFALSIVIGSYQGVELIGITLGETKDPQKNIKKCGKWCYLAYFDFLHWSDFRNCFYLSLEPIR